MKVELLRDGAPDCPLIRFYSPNVGEFTRLRQFVDQLSRVGGRSNEIGAADGYTLVNIRNLLLDNKGEGGMVEKETGCFVWSLAPIDWEAVSELLEPLTDPSALGSYQWLDAAGRHYSEGLAVLASVSEEGFW
jgi:hypothetical protein